MNKNNDGTGQGHEKLAARHLRVGWWCLLIFLCGGVVLEGFHGWKARMYLDVSASTRRLMWTLAHAHGTLLSLINIAFALTARTFAAVKPPSLRVASAALIPATFLLPGGFFLGGVVTYGGDPGVGILLVPLGALGLIAGVTLMAIRAGRE